MLNKSRIPTGLFNSLLMKTNHIKRFLENNGDKLDERSLAGYLCDLCEEKGIAVRAHVIARAQLDPIYGQQIFEGRAKNPSRDKIIQLSFGFPLNVDETQALLRRAKQGALYPKARRDAMILFCLNKGKTIMETQEMLYELGLTTFDFGEEKRNEQK